MIIITQYLIVCIQKILIVNTKFVISLVLVTADTFCL